MSGGRVQRSRSINLFDRSASPFRNKRIMKHLRRMRPKMGLLAACMLANSIIMIHATGGSRSSPPTNHIGRGGGHQLLGIAAGSLGRAICDGREGLVGLVAAAKAGHHGVTMKKGDLGAAVGVALGKVAPAICMGIGARKFGALWVAERAGEKFRRQAALYMTIPAIAGILNWATNKLAVWMIFQPESFVGVPLISRARPGEPLGWFGWQGIVPAKVRKMGSDIVDMTINELLDVKTIFANVDPWRISDLMAKGAPSPPDCLALSHTWLTPGRRGAARCVC